MKEKNIVVDEAKYFKFKRKQLISILLKLREIKISIYDRYFSTKLNKKQREDLIRKEKGDMRDNLPVIDPNNIKKRSKVNPQNFIPEKLFNRDDNDPYLLNDKFKIQPA